MIGSSIGHEEVLATIPQDWQEALSAEISRPYFVELIKKILEESKSYVIYPAVNDWFSFMKTPIDSIKVVIIGQDPYHGPQQAHGLCFSVQEGVKVPPSLVNIYRELEADIDGFKRPSHGCLQTWSLNGVLLLNATLTVRKGNANSHSTYGWDKFTDAIIKYLDTSQPKVFMLWGGFAQKKAKMISKKHLVLKSAHPSPLAANKGGWFGTKPFSKANAWLVENGQTAIDWTIPETVSDN